MSPLLATPLRCVLAAAGLAVSFLSRRAEMFLGPLLGRAVLALGFRRRIAFENIRNCLPELGPQGWELLLRRNYEHYGILFFEFLHFFSPIQGHYRAYGARISRLEGLEHLERANAKGKGVIVVSAHMGFWEMNPVAGALAGVKPTVVTTVLKPRWLHEKVTAARAEAGVAAALHPGSVPAVLKALRRGECVAFMNDQYARPPMGLRVRFFGVLADTLAAVAPIAARTGAAVVPVAGYRDAEGLCRVRVEPELEIDRSAGGVEATTARLAAKVEGWVRERPEQWLWIHRRFKHADWNDRI